MNVHDQRKKVKIQWLQDRNRSIVGNLDLVKREASRHFKNKKK